MVGKKMRVRAFIKMLLIISGVAITVTSVRPAVAREVVVLSLGGIVFADGRPIDKVVAIRLEAENSAMVAMAYTLDSGKFLFQNTTLESEDNYFLVIKDLDYKELRHRVDRGYFFQDSASAYIMHSSGSIILDLQSLPPEKKLPKSGLKAVDARQLKAEISDEARREYNLALKKIANGNSKEALEHMKKAVDLSPEFYDALIRLGSEYMRADQPDKARGILKRAQALNPNDPIPLTNLGIIQFQEGEKLESAGAGNLAAVQTDYRNAVELFEKALRLNSLAPRTNLYLGIAYYKLGVYDKSESLLINTLALDGRMHEARLTLISIYSRQNRNDAALKQIAEYLQANPDTPRRKQLEVLRAKIKGTSSPL
jgi:Flp pilus assembly protein TadD